MRRWFAKGRRPLAFYSLGVIALLAISVSVLVGTDLLSGASEQPATKKVTAPTAAQEAPRRAISESAATEGAAREKKGFRASKEAAAEKEAQEKAAKEAAQREAAQRAAERRAAEQATVHRAAQPAEEAVAASPATVSAPTVAPADTTMFLTIPKLGLSGVPVLEGTSEAVLSQGVGHLPGTGYPWIPGSNTYIAGHRLGYPGTVSDHVFWDLPSLTAGDEIYIQDANGQTYVYQVSGIMEVQPTDFSGTAPVGSDVVTLQTCIENYGDYWTPGPNWFVRYLVRADRVA
jgi:sortase A